MRINYLELLDLGDQCACCGSPTAAAAYIKSGPAGGIFCSAACAAEGPSKIAAYKAIVAAELMRRGVKFLPRQCVRVLLEP